MNTAYLNKLCYPNFADRGNNIMDKQLEYSEIYWENIRHQQQLEILHRKLKNRTNGEEDDIDIDIEGLDSICKTIPSKKDTDQNRRRQVSDEHIVNNKTKNTAFFLSIFFFNL